MLQWQIDQGQLGNRANPTVEPQNMASGQLLSLIIQVLRVRLTSFKSHCWPFLALWYWARVISAWCLSFPSSLLSLAIHPGIPFKKDRCPLFVSMALYCLNDPARGLLGHCESLCHLPSLYPCYQHPPLGHLLHPSGKRLAPSRDQFECHLP